MASDQSVSGLWKRVASELQTLVHDANELSRLLEKQAPSYELVSKASDLLQSLKSCGDLAKGARGFMLLSIHADGKRRRP